MKKIFFVFLTIGFLASCVTIEDRMLPSQERASADVIGTVEAKFVSLQFLHIVPKKSISKVAYTKLLQEAKRKYHGDIDVVNITAAGTYNALTLIPNPLTDLGIVGNIQTIWASGDVISISGKTFRTKDTVYEYPKLEGKKYTVIGTLVLRAKDKPILFEGATSINAALVEEAVKIGGHDIINVRYDTLTEGQITAVTAVVIKYID